MKATTALAVGAPPVRVAREVARGVVVLCAVAAVAGVVLWLRGADLVAETWFFPAGWSAESIARVMAEARLPLRALTSFHLTAELMCVLTGLVVAGALLRGEPSWFRSYAAVALALWTSVGGAIGVVLAGTLGEWVWLVHGLGWVALFPIAYLFPDGRFVPGWTRWAMIGWAAYLPVLGVLAALGIPTDPEGPFEIVPVLVLAATAVYAAIHRYRGESSPIVRRQLRWPAAALSVWLLVALLSSVSPLRVLMREESVPGLVAVAGVLAASYLAAALIPLSIGIAMLRHHLYDFDVWVNRTLIWTVLTAILALGYAVVAGLVALLWPGNDIAGLLVAVVTVAVLLHPVRLRVQRGVDRFVYGQSLEPKALLADLVRSREHILVAREDERRRLQRDLHDGLGPTLASLYQRVDAAQALVASAPDAAEKLLAEVAVQTRSLINDIRNLVHELRPPELDQLGLVGAVEAAGRRFPGLTVTVTGDAGQLSPVVEIAAYRIITEALTNVARHAQARDASVELSLRGDAVVVVVDDDGRGMAGQLAAGTGLRSMRERADELGGTLEVAARSPSGTRLRATLPRGGLL